MVQDQLLHKCLVLNLCSLLHVPLETVMKKKPSHMSMLASQNKNVIIITGVIYDRKIDMYPCQFEYFMWIGNYVNLFRNLGGIERTQEKL